MVKVLNLNLFYINGAEYLFKMNHHFMDPNTNSNNCQPNANRKQSYQNRFHSAQQQFNSLPPPPQKNPRLNCYANNPHYQPHIQAYNQQQQPANYGHSSYGRFYSPQVLFYVTNFGTHFYTDH